MRATKLMRAARLAGLKAEVRPSPLGVGGIIGPWNYPLQLVVLPASAAFAAGNRVMIKMSEITPRTSERMKSTAPTYATPPNSASSRAVQRFRPRSRGCPSTTCSSPVRLRSAHWCSRPPRKTSFQ
jgi:hypothetical protein